MIRMLRSRLTPAATREHVKPVGVWSPSTAVLIQGPTATTSDVSRADPLVRVDEKLAVHLPLWTSSGTLPASGPPPTLVGSMYVDEREMREDGFAACAMSFVVSSLDSTTLRGADMSDERSIRTQ